MRAVWRLLKKVPPFTWIIVAAVALAETLFWVPFLQMDSMIWTIPGDWRAWMWIPEFGWTYRTCFIFFMNVEIVGFHIPIIVIVWLTAKHLLRGR